MRIFRSIFTIRIFTMFMSLSFLIEKLSSTLLEYVVVVNLFKFPLFLYYINLMSFICIDFAIISQLLAGIEIYMYEIYEKYICKFE